MAIDSRRTQGVRPAEPLTRDRIVAAAVRVVDELGVDKLSIQGLARELEVTKTAITWHVGDRQALLDVVGGQWLESIVPPPPNDSLATWFRTFAHSYRAAAHRHPHLARLAVPLLASGRVAPVIPEAIMSELVRDRVGHGRLAHLYNTLIAALVGFVELELEQAARGPAPAALDLESFPTIASHATAVVDRAFGVRSGADPVDCDQSFALLVDTLIAGVTSRTRRRRGR